MIFFCFVVELYANMSISGFNYVRFIRFLKLFLIVVPLMEGGENALTKNLLEHSLFRGCDGFRKSSLSLLELVEFEQ